MQMPDLPGTEDAKDQGPFNATTATEPAFSKMALTAINAMVLANTNAGVAKALEF